MRGDLFPALAAALLVPFASDAAVLWNESINGDLPNTQATAQDLGVLAVGSSDVSGLSAA